MEWLLLVAWLAGACDGSKKADPGEACTLSNACGDTMSCSYGTCHATCVTTRDCPLGQSCLMTSAGGVCQLPVEADCRTTAACPAGLFCAVDYRCRSVCQSAAGCTKDQVCVDGVCADSGDLDLEGRLPVKNPGPSLPGQCKEQRDCAALGSDYAGYVCKDSLCQPPVEWTWACLDGAPETATGTIRRSMTFVHMLTQMPLEGIALSLCAKLDNTCMLPIVAYQSNSAGQIEIELPVGFDGYFQAKGGGIYPTLIFLPSTRMQHLPSTFPLFPEAFYPTLVQSLGTTVAEVRSMVLVTALDCLGRPAAGISLGSPAADSETTGFVMVGGLLSRTSSLTDVSGGGGFVNLPAGPVLIHATIAASNRLVGTLGAQARPGYLSMVTLMPNGS